MKTKEETAILITKKINTKKSDQEAIKSVFRMRFGIFNDALNDAKPKQYFLEFMTKKGKKAFLVEAQLYHQIKINSLGILKHDEKDVLDFDVKKIATKKDVQELNW